MKVQCNMCGELINKNKSVEVPSSVNFGGAQYYYCEECFKEKEEAEERWKRTKSWLMPLITILIIVYLVIINLGAF